MDPNKKNNSHSKSKISENEDEMSKYGIVRSSIEYFLYRDFKYMKLEDALAQAKWDGQRS